jgi:Flp pilus assembly protein TadG
MLITLAGFVFLSVVAWRLMKAHEMLASALKDVASSLRTEEQDDRGT